MITTYSRCPLRIPVKGTDGAIYLRTWTRYHDWWERTIGCRICVCTILGGIQRVQYEGLPYREVKTEGLTLKELALDMDRWLFSLGATEVTEDEWLNKKDVLDFYRLPLAKQIELKRLAKLPIPRRLL